jgi:putative inorganic carbon (HCO3(-)) transporter
VSRESGKPQGTKPRGIAAGTPGRDELLPRVFAAAFGALLGLALLKFGNPVVLEKFIAVPGDGLEMLVAAWPISWSYPLLAIVAALGLFAVRPRRTVPLWILILPACWLIWQFVSATQTVDGTLTLATLKHFVACAVCFYLGHFALSRVRNLSLFWLPLVAGFLLVVAMGLQQRFGGLEESRKYFYTYLYPGIKELPSEYARRIASNRIFSTLFYPNALAGALLMLTPAVLIVIWEAERRFSIGARRFLVVAVAAGTLACLYWSGSKGGWLLMLVIIMTVLLNKPFPTKVKWVIALSVLIVGLSGFFLKYAGFFQRGATSVSARVDYWKAASQVIVQRPFFGSGPGTFGVMYQKLKRPESEMARLAHNDYLQQASDSGVIGFLAYSLFWAGSLAWSFFKGQSRKGSIRWAVWLGLFGWSAQGLMEFGLYIPALAWTAFALAGWLLAVSSNGFDKSTAAV